MTPGSSDHRDEFYVGYEPGMPPGIAMRVRWTVAGLLIVALLASSGALVWHHRLAPATFAFGHPGEVTGVLRRRPYPHVVVDGRTSWLVGVGKFGAEASLSAVPDGPVALRGTRIERGPHRMLEIVRGSARMAPRADSAAAGGFGTKAVPLVPGTNPTNGVPPAPVPDSTRGGPKGADSAEMTLRGEIVDSKCFLGVMNPGEGTVHRDCARVCLRGGIPPMLLVRGTRAEEALVLLVDAAGEPIGRQLADLAGQAVEVRGRLTRDGETLVLATDRALVVRLAPGRESRRRSVE